MSTIIRFGLAAVAAVSFALTSTGASAAPADDQPGGYTTCPQWQDCSPDPEPEDGPDDYAPCPEGGCENPDDEDNPDDGGEEPGDGEEPEGGDEPEDGEPEDGGGDPGQPAPGGSEADVASADDDVVVVQPNFTG